MALSSAYLRRVPVSNSLIYLVVGIVLSPLGTDLLQLNVRDAQPWLERLTEVAVIGSLFLSGLKMRLPLRNPGWSAAYRLAMPAMLTTILGVALFTHFAFGLDPPLALLLGAILAPTDPVLASAIAVNNAGDHDRVRYGLSGEAGLNDGLAFPFVLFALLWVEHGSLGSWAAGWTLFTLAWGIAAGLLLGYLLGRSVGRLMIRISSENRDITAPADFLSLALIALSYVGANLIGALGFIAVFAAGVGMRHAELQVVAENPSPEAGLGDMVTIDPAGVEPPDHSPAEELVPAQVREECLEEPAVAAGMLVSRAISFGDTIERLLEVVLVVLVGAALAWHWDVRAVPLALALVLIIRPLSARLLLIGSPTTAVQRWLMGWFGIRGLGSLYLLSYALNHGIRGADASDAVGLVISVVALSIVAHGITAHPVLSRYERALARR